MTSRLMIAILSAVGLASSSGCDPSPTTAPDGTEGTDGRDTSYPFPPLPDLPDAAPCERDGTPPAAVVMLGDSYFDATDVPDRLWDLARAEGALQEHERYRTYHHGGARLATGEILEQFDVAVSENATIEVVLMTGGGNDVLVDGDTSCLVEGPGSPACLAEVDNVVAEARALWDTMADVGTESILYVSYADLRSETAAASNATLERLATRMADACASQTSPRCTFVDARETFSDHPEYLQDDGIHPSPAGARALAELMWATMVDACMAQ